MRIAATIMLDRMGIVHFPAGHRAADARQGLVLECLGGMICIRS